jgi:acyl-CoA synthetase (AMP-forming)/AMP-acid ligase II
MNLAWWLETGAWEYPEKTAIINPDGSEINYSQLNTLSNKIGNLLSDRYGVRPDDVVTTLAGETHWHVAIMFGLWKIGAVVCPLNRTQTYPKFVQDIRITRAKLLIVEPKFLDAAARLSSEREIANAALLGERSDAFPDFKTLIRDASDQIRMTPRANADLAIINFTTGTTGPSKGAMLPHGALITSYLSGRHWAGMKSSERGLCPLYLFHAGGLSIVLTALVAHSTVILMGEPWNSDRFIDLMERHRPDWVFIMVPVMTRDLARNPRFAGLDCTGVRLHLAGEPVHPEVQKLWEDRGARTLILYGMTESMAVCVTSNSFYYGDDASVGKGLVGKPNREFGDVKLIDPLTHEEITEPGIRGELCFRGDVLTPGYYNDPARTRESIDPEGWFHTFDLAVRNNEGYFTVGGRTDDIISSGGEKLSLIEVENAILQAPFVKDAACIGVPHTRFGHSPAAIVAPAEDLEEHELMRRLDEFLRENLERWKRPRLVIRVDEVPRTLAKRTKIWPKLREMIQGVELSGEGVTTLTAYRSRLTIDD